MRPLPVAALMALALSVPAAAAPAYRVLRGILLAASPQVTLALPGETPALTVSQAVYAPAPGMAEEGRLLSLQQVYAVISPEGQAVALIARRPAATVIGTVVRTEKGYAVRVLPPAPLPLPRGPALHGRRPRAHIPPGRRPVRGPVIPVAPGAPAVGSGGQPVSLSSLVGDRVRAALWPTPRLCPPPCVPNRHRVCAMIVRPCRVPPGTPPAEVVALEELAAPNSGGGG